MSTEEQTQKQKNVAVAAAFLEESMRKVLGNGMTTLRELKGLSDGEMEAIYAIGYNYFRSGKIDEAEKIFKALLFLDHLEKKYWFAFGGVKQSQRDFKNALQSYQVCAFLDIENPKPQYHCAECHLALGDRENALNALDALDEYAPKDTELGRTYRAKAAALRAKIGELPADAAK